MWTLCDFCVVESKLCFKIFEKEKNERISSEKQKQFAISACALWKLYYLD